MTNMDAVIRAALCRFEALYTGARSTSWPEPSINFATTALSSSTAQHGDATLIAVRPSGHAWDSWEPDLYTYHDGDDVAYDMTHLDESQDEYSGLEWSTWHDWSPQSWR